MPLTQINSTTILENIQRAAANNDKLLAILIDPDKVVSKEISTIAEKINHIGPDYVFVGGSTVESGATDIFVGAFKNYCDIPVVLFPGCESQISNKADALLFLSLLSGRNPEYLIEQQLRAVKKLEGSSLEFIPTGYILVDGGNTSSVQRVSNTAPISQDALKAIVTTAKAGEYMGKQLIYLEAGSGAQIPVNTEILQAVKAVLHIPMIVGGGLRSKAQINAAYESGADLVVVGTAFEQNLNFSKANG